MKSFLSALKQKAKWLIPVAVTLAAAPLVFNQDPQPVNDMASFPVEVTEKRTYNSVTYLNPDGSYTLETHAGHINYKDAEGNLQPSDFTFEDKGTYWEMAKHNYKLQVAKDFSAPLLVRYTNKFEGANHSITYEPKMLAWVNNPDFSDMVVFRTAQPVIGVVNGNVIRFTDAYGPGIHFEVTLQRSGFKKEIVIETKSALELPPTTNHKLVALFQYDGPGLNIKANDRVGNWDKSSYLESETGFQVMEASGKESFIKPAYIVDATVPAKPQSIKVFWKQYNGKLYQAKVLPKVFLNNATYPVRADTVTSYFVFSDDGITTFNGSGSWSAVHDATSGTLRGGAEIYIQTINNGNDAAVDRCFFTFDTSGIGSGSTVSAATVNFWGNVGGGGGSTYEMNVYQSTHSDTVIGADFDLATTNALSNTSITSAGWSTSGYNAFAFNSTSTSYVSVTGYTKIALREAKWDVPNIEPTLNTTNRFIALASVEDTNGSRDPYISVTYTAASASIPQQVMFFE